MSISGNKQFHGIVINKQNHILKTRSFIIISYKLYIAKCNLYPVMTSIFDVRNYLYNFILDKD